MKIRVLLVADQVGVRDGLRFLTESHEDICVVGETASLSEASGLLKHLNPDVAIVDAATLNLSGFDTLERLRKNSPLIRSILLSVYPFWEMVMGALLAGIQGYVLKGASGKELIAAIRTVHAGRYYLSPQVSVVLDHFGEMQSNRLQNPLESLSPRELEVLRLVVEGKSSLEIANALFLSVKTVETYRCRLMRKLGVQNLANLIKFAIRHGLTAF